MGAVVAASRLQLCNVHPSLLLLRAPAHSHAAWVVQYRGSAPIPHAILNGETSTGISVIEVHPERFDAGAVLYQKEVPIGHREGAAA